VLADYDAPGWADVVADHTDAVVTTLRGMTSKASIPNLASGFGIHAGITFQVHGNGPSLVLLPFFLAPSQWEPAIPSLAQHFTVIVLGGRHLGGVAALEDRAQGRSYAGMIGGLFDEMAPEAGESILDVGCGSGALDRLLARRFGDANPITATDVNPFLLREAASLATEDQVADRITFRQGNAERLPFPDASFDHAFTVTVFEEVDADLALRELFRVVRPGGRVGVIVRAIDMPQWWHLDLPEEVRRKANVPPQSCGPRGVADASLYRRMGEAGFGQLTCFPTLVTFDRPDGPIWRYREDHVLSQLTEPETEIWHTATKAARQAGLLFMANPLHRAVGRKPIH
jgi:SAM-dependent methyltransferase